jgi:hypothetical protein
MDKYNRDFLQAKHSFKPTVEEVINPEHTKPKLWRKIITYSGIAIGIIALFAIPAVIDLKQPRVISIIADDISDSAMTPAYIALRNSHCKSLGEHYKSGDEIVHFLFADRPEIFQELTIANQLDNLNLCKDTNPNKSEVEISKHPGTSLILLLEQIKTKIDSQRNQGDKKAVVVTITLQEIEPGSDQPKVDFNRIKMMIRNLTQDKKVVIAIIGTKGYLQNTLEAQLKDEQHVRIFPIQNIQQAVDWGMTTGRSL